MISGRLSCALMILLSVIAVSLFSSPAQGEDVVFGEIGPFPQRTINIKEMPKQKWPLSR